MINNTTSIKNSNISYAHQTLMDMWNTLRKRCIIIRNNYMMCVFVNRHRTCTLLLLVLMYICIICITYVCHLPIHHRRFGRIQVSNTAKKVMCKYENRVISMKPLVIITWMPGQCGRNLDCPEDSCIDSTTAPDDPEYSWIRWTAPADDPATRSSSSSSSSASRWWWLHNSSASRWWWLQQLQRSGPLFDRWWTRWRMNCFDGWCKTKHNTFFDMCDTEILFACAMRICVYIAIAIPLMHPLALPRSPSHQHTQNRLFLPPIP